MGKLHGEGYKAPGQAFAIAKSMGYAEGGEAFDPRDTNQDGKVSWWERQMAKHSSWDEKKAEIKEKHKGGIETPGWEKIKNAGWAALDFVPIVGDIKGAYELVQELRKDPINWAVAAGLTAALVVGIVPGIGDAAAAGIKKAVRAAADAGKLVPADLIGIARAAKDGDWDFLKGWGVPADSASVGAKVVDEVGLKEYYAWQNALPLDDKYKYGTYLEELTYNPEAKPPAGYRPHPLQDGENPVEFADIKAEYGYNKGGIIGGSRPVKRRRTIIG